MASVALRRHAMRASVSAKALHVVDGKLGGALLSCGWDHVCSHEKEKVTNKRRERLILHQAQRERERERTIEDRRRFARSISCSSRRRRGERVNGVERDEDQECARLSSLLSSLFHDILTKENVNLSITGDLISPLSAAGKRERRGEKERVVDGTGKKKVVMQRKIGRCAPFLSLCVPRSWCPLQSSPRSIPVLASVRPDFMTCTAKFPRQIITCSSGKIFINGT